MLTFPEIIQKSTQLRKDNAKFVEFSTPKFGYTKDGHAFVAVKSWTKKVKLPDGTIIDKDPIKYVTVVEFLDKDIHANLSCSCPDFLYRYEVALNRKEAARIEYSNGELPVIRNPMMIPACCKHCIALFNRLKGVMTKTMMKPIKPKVKKTPAKKATKPKTTTTKTAKPKTTKTTARLETSKAVPQVLMKEVPNYDVEVKPASRFLRKN